MRTLASAVTLRGQVQNNRTFTRILQYNYCYPNPKYKAMGYLDPLGYIAEEVLRTMKMRYEEKSKDYEAILYGLKIHQGLGALVFIYIYTHTYIGVILG